MSEARGLMAWEENGLRAETPHLQCFCNDCLKSGVFGIAFAKVTGGCREWHLTAGTIRLTGI
jgi:hypothetical protein